MAPRREYERDRVRSKITQLKRENDQLTHNIMRTKRDEQFEVERLQREFKSRIMLMKNRQNDIMQEISHLESELRQIEERMLDEGKKQESATIEAKKRRLGPHL